MSALPRLPWSAAGRVGRIRPALRLAFFVFLATAPRPVAGQAVTGMVREAGVPGGVVGALVRLVASDGTRRGPPFLTASDGRYLLTAEAPGSYHLVVERIGYATTRVGPLLLEAGAVVTRDVTVARVAIELEGLTVEGAGRACDLTRGGDGGTQLLWEQVRKALDVATWTRREGSLSFRLARWERRLDPRTLAIVEEDRRPVRVLGGNSVRSLPAEELARGGYVRAASGGMVDWFAPDAETVLSDSFLSTHCFSVRAGPEGTPWVGLAFEPLPDRDTADVAGVMWVDRGSARLDRIDFSYTESRLPVGQEHAGGSVRFTELPDGRWMVAEWHIRAPAVRVVRTRSPLGQRDRPMVDAVHESGSQVVSVGGAGWTWTQDLPTVAVRGVVWDSIAAAPLEGAKVRLAGRGWRTTTDARGGFRLEGVPAGRYRLLFDHPRLDSLGSGARGRDVLLEEGVEEVALAIPSRGTLLAEGCPAGSGGTVVGWVTAPDATTPVSAVEVVARGADGGELGATVSGVDGSYRFCDLPVGAAVEVSAVSGLPGSASGVRVTPADDGHRRVDLSVAWTAAAEAADSPDLEVLGTVVDASDGAPLAAAEVALVDTAGTVEASVLTDDAGRFRLLAGRDEPHRLRVTRLGYGGALGDVLPVRARRHRVRVTLAPGAVEVEGVVVTVEGRRPRLDREGFYERAVQGFGTLLDREGLALESAAGASDALLRVPGFVRLDQSSLTGNTTKRYVQLRGARRASGRANCMPAVYLDGQLVRWGQDLASGDGYPSLDELVDAQDIEAVEVYDTPSTIPPRFMGPGSLCGVLVVWTR